MTEGGMERAGGTTNLKDLFERKMSSTKCSNEMLFIKLRGTRLQIRLPALSNAKAGLRIRMSLYHYKFKFGLTLIWLLHCRQLLILW